MPQTSGGSTPRFRKTHVRRAAVALAVPALIASAAACGGQSGSDDGKNGAIPAVSGSSDKPPKVDKGVGAPPKGLKVKVLKQGHGKKVKRGDSLNANYDGRLWNGKQFDSSWKRGQPATFQIGTGKVIKGWDNALVGKRLGSRVEMVVPPAQGYGKQGQPPQIPGNSTLVFVVDLKKIMPSQIDGKPVGGQPDPQLPKVSTKVDKDNAPEITMPKGKEQAPDKIISDTVVQGDGKKVGKNSTILTNFTAKLWKGGKQLDDTWRQGGPQEIPISKIPGWSKALEGKKAGSRVVVSVPKSEFPAKQRKQFGSGVVFSVDVLDVD
jgi:FKBP-type peptidyl-prolyl cis-trans isomerase